MFCTNCGSQIGDNSRFCPSCGQSLGAASAGGYQAPAAVLTPLKYDIEGHNLQIARVHLEPGQEIYAEAGKMIYKSANVDWDTRMTGQSVSQKIIGAIKRKLMGESLFFTHFRASNFAGEVGFAGHYPGKIQVFELAPGQTMMVQRDGFLFAQASVTIDIAMVRRLGAGLLGGEGIHSAESSRVRGRCSYMPEEIMLISRSVPTRYFRFRLAIWWPLSQRVNYDIQMVGSIRTAIFGGEGLFLTTLTGPGRVILQSMTLERLRHELSPHEHKHNGDERNPLGALASGDLSSFFRSDD